MPQVMREQRQVTVLQTGWDTCGRTGKMTYLGCVSGFEALTSPLEQQCCGTAPGGPIALLAIGHGPAIFREDVHSWLVLGRFARWSRAKTVGREEGQKEMNKSTASCFPFTVTWFFFPKRLEMNCDKGHR